MTEQGQGVHGTIEHDTDWQAFDIDLEAGQRYRFELSGLGAQNDGSLYLNVRSASPEFTPLDGAMAFGDAQGLARTLVTPTRSGTYQVAVSGWLASAESIGYQLRAVPVAADDHGDVPSSATPLAVGDVISGVLGPDGDRDAFAVDLPAAGRYVVTVEGDGIDPVQRVNVGWLGSDAQWLTGSFDATFAVAATTPGRYALLLEAPVWDLGLQGGYRVSLRPQEDDHADRPGQATPFTPGDALHGTLDVAGDVDMFSTTLEAGQTVALRVQGPIDGTSMLWLVVWHDGEFVASCYPQPHSPDILVQWTAREAGTYVAEVGGQNLATPYTLLTQAAVPDDHAARADEATAWVLGDVQAARFEHPGDVDCFALDLQGGSRYRVDLRGADGQPTGRLVVEAFDASGALSYVNDWWSDEGGVITFEAAQDGRYVVTACAAGTVGAYTLQAQAIPSDDHADSASLATPLSPGVPTDATLDPGHDRDCFTFDAEAGQAYRVTMIALDDATWQSYELYASDAVGILAGSSRFAPTQGERYDSQAFVPHGSGPVSLALSVDAPAGGRYRVSVERADPAAAYNREPTSMGVLPLGQPQEDVNEVSGTATADTLRGGNSDDVLRGGPGDDSLYPGGGYDTVRAGAGFDTAHFTGSVADRSVVPRSLGQWAVIDTRADGGTALLDGVERLVFDDATLAVDFGGHAGAVLRMSVLCTGWSGVDPYLTADALRLLDATDRIDALADFAWAALDGPAHGASASHEWLVRLAQDNVPGLLPSEGDVQHWVQALDAGQVTPQAALALACDAAATGQLVDLIGLAWWPIWLPPAGA